ncbi:AAA family ATPase [Streptococcus marimammalium]|uniref:AAA family ATPase n=1 Tax=Streptococcus marimammalium TaxID=269666 RepID=UPI00037F251A|nr:AAA family ATPase [Streptococcus marimammalium]
MNELLINELTIDWSKIDKKNYIRSISSFQNFEKLVFDNPISFFSGENGSGKSTLLEAIAIAYGFNPEGGCLNYQFSTYDSHSNLNNAIRLAKTPINKKWGYFLRA